ncbi:hypothetical protein V6N13_024000 [Hibiscus sabdariffa]
MAEGFQEVEKDTCDERIFSHSRWGMLDSSVSCNLGQPYIRKECNLERRCKASLDGRCTREEWRWWMQPRPGNSSASSEKGPNLNVFKRVRHPRLFSGSLFNL